MPKPKKLKEFTVRFTVENPNSLFYDVKVKAKSKDDALLKADDIDLDGVEWQTSDGNYIDTGDVNTEILDE